MLERYHNFASRKLKSFKLIFRTKVSMDSLILENDGSKDWYGRRRKSRVEEISVETFRDLRFMAGIG